MIVLAVAILVATVAFLRETRTPAPSQPPADNAATTINAATNPNTLPRMVDLGADKCIPCKKMALGSAAFGALLLVAYCLGHCGLVLAGGTSIGLVQRLVDSLGWNRNADLLRKFVGALILLVGAYLLFS